MAAVRRRGWQTIAAAAIAAGAATSAAGAATPVAGGSYHGSLGATQSAVRISLRVSSDRHQVRSVTLSTLPIYCTGSPPPSARTMFRAAAIDHAGSFTARGRVTIAVGPLKGTAVATLTVTGSFANNRREHGTVTTTFLGSGSKCSGHSPYTTKA